MKIHTKIYLNYFGYTTSDFIPCELCHTTANDTHHIEARQRGGSKDKDVIENLMALCRICHEQYGDKKQHMEYLKEIHLKFMENHK
jgi:5-methylcytosine-specific restriction endonuclease McrA